VLVIKKSAGKRIEVILLFDPFRNV
jgi:hypothetical protein